MKSEFRRLIIWSNVRPLRSVYWFKSLLCHERQIDAILDWNCINTIHDIISMNSLLESYILPYTFWLHLKNIRVRKLTNGSIQSFEVISRTRYCLLDEWWGPGLTPPCLPIKGDDVKTPIHRGIHSRGQGSPECDVPDSSNWIPDDRKAIFVAWFNLPDL